MIESFITRQIAAFLRSDCKNSTSLVLPTVSMPAQKELCFLVWFPNQSLHITVRQKALSGERSYLFPHSSWTTCPYKRYHTSSEAIRHSVACITNLLQHHIPSSSSTIPEGLGCTGAGKDKHWQWRHEVFPEIHPRRTCSAIAQQMLQFWAAPESGLCLWHRQCKPCPHVPTHSSEQQLPIHMASSVTCGDQEGEMPPAAQLFLPFLLFKASKQNTSAWSLAVFKSRTISKVSTSLFFSHPPSPFLSLETPTCRKKHTQKLHPCTPFGVLFLPPFPTAG